MKCLIIVILYCSIAVKGYSSNYDLGDGNYLFYDDIQKLFLTANRNNSLGFIPCKENIALLNLRTAQYVLINTRTLFAIRGRIENMQLTDQSAILMNIHRISERYPTIQVDTPNSFDFNHLMACYYRNQYDLNMIFPQEPSLVEHMTETCNVLLQRAEEEQEQRCLRVNIPGFLESISPIRSKPLTAVTNVVKDSLNAFGEVTPDITSTLIGNCKLGAKAIIDFSTSFADFISVVVDATIHKTLDWIRDVTNYPRLQHLILGGKTYYFYLRVIYKQFVLRFAMTSSMGIDQDIRFIFLPDTFIIFNERLNYALYIHKRNFILINLQSPLIFIGKFNLLMKISGLFHPAPNIVRLTYTERYLQAVENIKQLLRNVPQGMFSITNLVNALNKGGPGNIGGVVGPNFAEDVNLFYGNIFGQCTCSKTNALSDIIQLVLGHKHSLLTSTLAKSLSLIASTGQPWSYFLNTMFGITSGALGTVNNVIGGISGIGHITGRIQDDDLTHPSNLSILAADTHGESSRNLDQKIHG